MCAKGPALATVLLMCEHTGGAEQRGPHVSFFFFFLMQHDGFIVHIVLLIMEMLLS